MESSNITTREAGLQALTKRQITMIAIGGPSAPGSSWAAASPSATPGRRY